jgi:hypothetical protein
MKLTEHLFALSIKEQLELLRKQSVKNDLTEDTVDGLNVVSYTGTYQNYTRRKTFLNLPEGSH